MTKRRITIMLVALCTLAGAAIGGAALMPAMVPSTHAPASSSSAATDAPVAKTDESTTASGPAATDGPERQVSDCDLVDIDGNNNTVSVNLTSNATASEDEGVTVRIRCGAGNATTVDHDLIDIDGNNNTVTLVVQAEDGEIVIGENENTADSNGLHVALNCGSGTVADCDAIDIDGYNNTVTLVVRSEDGRTVHEFGTGEQSADQSAEQQSVAEGVTYYQVDFVVGEPIENLRGPEGYYTPDKLIRFAHGSTEEPVMRRSDGEFLAAEERARCIDSNPITVENGTAKMWFTVKEGCGSVTLTLASYEKPGPGWSPETEAKQEFVDAETHTFGPGTYTLTVALPGGEANTTNTSDSAETNGDN